MRRVHGKRPGDAAARAGWPAHGYRTALTGGTVAEHAVDLVFQVMLAHKVTRRRKRAAIQIGHSAGVIETEIGGDGAMLRATLRRTARRILKGTVFVPE
jgi:2-methylaconitate cis-trans-isomerase PrpF